MSGNNLLRASLGLTLFFAIQQIGRSMAETSTTEELLCKLPIEAPEPPIISSGSFDTIINRNNKFKRDIIIYWKSIDEEKYCNLIEYRAYYVTKSKDDKLIFNFSNTTYANHAIFVDLNTLKEYSIKLIAFYVRGHSSVATINIPKESERLPQPTSFRTRKFNNSSYELTWKYNSFGKRIVAKRQIFVIFWCESEPLYPYQCNGPLDFVFKISTISTCNITGLNPLKYYQFAISANLLTVVLSDKKPKFRLAPTATSGMVWESCSPQHFSLVNGLRSFWIAALGSTFVELRWKLDCNDEIGLIRGYTFYVCRTENNISRDCLDSPIESSIFGDDVYKINSQNLISNLAPNTSYMVSMTMITAFRVNLHGEFIQFTTLSNSE